MSGRTRHRVALIGCGKIALEGHLPALLQHEQFELPALCDIDIARAQRLAERCPGSPPTVSHDYREVLHKVDACILAMQPQHSVDVAIDLLHRGFPILDEKPLATNLDDGQRLMRAVHDSGGVYQIGFIFRYGKLIGDVAAWIQQSSLPRLYQVSIFDERPSQHVADEQRGIQDMLRFSSAVTQEGSHVFDWITQLGMRPLRTVKASAMRTDPAFAGPNLWIIHADDEAGSILQLTIGWLLEDQPESRLQILSRDAKLDLNLVSGAGEISTGGLVRSVKTTPLRQAWQAQLDHFASAIETRRVTGATIDDGMRALQATIACERAAAGNETIDLRGV